MTRAVADQVARARSTCPCRTGAGLRHTIAADLRRCTVQAQHDQHSTAVLGLVRALLFYPGFYGVAAYRLSHAALHSRLPRPAHAAVYFAALLLQRVAIMRTRVEISAQAHIGPGMLVNHAQGAVIGEVSAGCNLTVSHYATIGRGIREADDVPGTADPAADCPALGDRVWIGVGAVVVGGIAVGDDAVVGANAVVARDVPCRAVVSGAPARIRSHQGSFAFVFYAGMDADPDRRASVGQRSDAV